MSLTDGQPGLIKILTGAVVLASGLVALSLLATNPSESDPASLSAMARAPASLIGKALATTSVAAPPLERTTTLDFNCQIPATAEVTNDTRQVRITGKICDTESVVDTEVTNLTNGFTATMFQPDPRKFSSDYIHLAEGQNQIRISILRANGERINQEVAVLRPTATPSK